MDKNAGRFQGSSDSLLSEAESLWRAGYYRTCLELLSTAEPSAERYLLSAKASYWLRQYEDALSFLRAGDAYFGAIEHRVDADSLAALMHAFCGRHREAQAFLERHGNSEVRSAGLAIATEALYRSGLCAWMRDDMVRAERIARDMEFVEPQPRLYTKILRSWVCVGRNSLREQLRVLAGVLTAFSNAPGSHVGLEANLVQAASSLCRDLFDEEAFRLVAERADKLPWTEDLRVFHFQTMRNLAWSRSLLGEHIAGIRSLNRAKELAPTSFLRVMSMLDYASIASASGDRSTAAAELLDADETLNQTNWDGFAGEEPMALLVSAELFAEFNPPRAKQHLDTFDRAKNMMSSGYAYAHGKRLQAIESYCRGKVMQKNGDVASARPYLKQAFAIFERLGFEWRAAQCALLLYVGGAGDVWLRRARDASRNYPRSFVGQDVERHALEAQSELQKITPRQREIFALLQEGATIEEVASRLNASPNTVRVHITRIHQAFGVRNRAELLKHARKIAG